MIIWTPRIDEGNLITPLAMVPRDVVIALAARSSTAELTARDLEIQLYKLVQTYVSGSRLEITGLLDAGQGALNTARTYWAILSFLLVGMDPLVHHFAGGPTVAGAERALRLEWDRCSGHWCAVGTTPLRQRPSWVQASYFGAVGKLALADERLMDAIPTDVSARAALEERVEEVIEEVRRGRSVDDAPSLVQFARVLLTGEVPDDDDLDRPSRDSRWPMLDEGRAFRHRHRLKANGGAWLRGWAKYRLWRLVETASRIVRTVVVWVKLTLFGARDGCTSRSAPNPIAFHGQPMCGRASVRARL